MKSLVFSFLIIAFANLTIAQNLQREFKTAQFTSTNCIAAGDSLIYAVVNDNLWFQLFKQKSTLYQFDTDLNALDSVELTGNFLKPNDYFFSSDVEVDTNGNIFSLYNYFTYDSTSTCGIMSYILVHDKHLSLVDSIAIDEDSLSEEFFELIFYENYFLATGGTSLCGVGEIKPTVYAYDLVNKTSSIKRFDSFQSANQNLAMYFRDPVHFEGKIILRAEPLISPTTNNRLGNVVLDTSLNVLKVGSFNEKQAPDFIELRGKGAFIPVSEDSVYQLSVAWSEHPNRPPGTELYQNFGYSLLDSNYSVTTIDTLPLCGYNCQLGPGRLVQASWDAYDYNSSDSVLFVQQERFVWMDDYYYQDTVPFYIYNFNGSKGRMNWIRKIERNYTCGGHAVAALPGNRWAVSFNEYNWDKYPGENLSVHIWILNGSGDIISQREFKKPLAKLELFPNPAQDVLSIELPTQATKNQESDLTLVIYDLQGREQLREKLKSLKAQIDVSALSEGLYTVQIIKENLPVAVSKLVVER